MSNDNITWLKDWKIKLNNLMFIMTAAVEWVF